jgi:hypothetical protein
MLALPAALPGQPLQRSFRLTRQAWLCLGFN